MCNFLSGIALKNGDVLTHPMLDSHSDLVRYFKLPDTVAYVERFAKVELTPADWMDPATWRFRLDEEMVPAWWEDVAAKVEQTLRSIAGRMIIRGEHELLVDGCWIIGGEAKVRDVRSGRIMRVQDSATVSDVRGSATVRNVRGSATVRNVWGSATVRDVGDSATVRDVWGSATVSGVGGSATVSGVGGSATVRGVWGSATVRDVGPNVTLDTSAKAHLKGETDV
jgi:hypothetical protein